ncbi:MAG TPA: NADPH:quinone oxidoreductase family protein [Acidimicrobiales bacterium]
MRAAVCHEYGPPEVVRVGEHPSPELGAGQVRVRVGAAAVNFPDVLLIANLYQVSVPTPFVPGSEYAGEVVEVADDVATLAVGDRVTGGGLVGAFAEEAVVAAAHARVVPSGVSDADAAAFGVAHRTAWHALRSFGHLRSGDQLVVLGAGGGVGLAAVQLGTHLGAVVTAVASSPEKLAAAKACGAVNLIDHRSDDVRAALQELVPDGADVVIDPVGGDLSEVALRRVRWGGRFVVIGFASGTIPAIPLNLVLLKGVQVVGFQLRDLGLHLPDEMARNDTELDGLLAAGEIVPHIGARLPLDRVAEALRLVGDGQAVGKVVIDVAAPA